MVRFPWQICPSYLKYDRHPLTIPRHCNKQLVQEGLDDDSVSIVTPHGTMSGHIYHGHCSWGPFYEVKTFGGYDGDPMTHFKRGERVVVEIARVGEKVRVTIRYA